MYAILILLSCLSIFNLMVKFQTKVIFTIFAPYVQQLLDMFYTVIHWNNIECNNHQSRAIK